MHTVALAPRRHIEAAAEEAREQVNALLAALRSADISRIVKASETAYLAVGTLYALARAEESR